VCGTPQRTPGQFPVRTFPCERSVRFGTVGRMDEGGFVERVIRMAGNERHVVRRVLTHRLAWTIEPGDEGCAVDRRRYVVHRREKSKPERAAIAGNRCELPGHLPVLSDSQHQRINRHATRRVGKEGTEPFGVHPRAGLEKGDPDMAFETRGRRVGGRQGLRPPECHDRAHHLGCRDRVRFVRQQALDNRHERLRVRDECHSGRHGADRWCGVLQRGQQSLLDFGQPGMRDKGRDRCGRGRQAQYSGGFGVVNAGRPGSAFGRRHQQRHRQDELQAPCRFQQASHSPVPKRKAGEASRSSGLFRI
jgi:hypothetical protein